MSIQSSITMNFNKEEFEFTKEWSEVSKPLLKSEDPPGMFSNVVGRGKTCC